MKMIKIKHKLQNGSEYYTCKASVNPAFIAYSFNDDKEIILTMMDGVVFHIKNEDIPDQLINLIGIERVNVEEKIK